MLLRKQQRCYTLMLYIRIEACFYSFVFFFIRHGSAGTVVKRNKRNLPDEIIN